MTASIKAVKALEFDGMANGSELLRNVVKANKPKMLTGLNQKVRDGHGGIQFPPSETRNITGEQAGPNPSGRTGGTW